MEKFSTDTLCKNLDRTCRHYHNHTSPFSSGCQHIHYTTEKGKASALRELNVARSEVLHYVGGMSHTNNHINL